MLRVHLDVHEHVHAGQGGDVHGDQAGVTVVHQEVGAQRGGGEVVHAAGAKGDVAHDEGLLHPRKPAVCESGQRRGRGEGWLGRWGG